MDGSELDSFIQKFKQLWHSGLSAHLDLDTHAGQAWVGLRVRLGHAPGPLHIRPHRTRDGPSRQRRRDRRAASRQEEAEEAPQENTQRNETVVNENEPAEVVDEAERAAAVIVAAEDPADQQEVAENAANHQEVAEEATVEEVGEIAVEKTATTKDDFPCELCNSRFRNIRGLRTHVGRVHRTKKVTDKAKNGNEDNTDIESSEVNSCDRCDFVGSTPAELNAHKSTKHLFGRSPR